MAQIVEQQRAGEVKKKTEEIELESIVQLASARELGEEDEAYDGEEEEEDDRVHVGYAGGEQDRYEH